MSSRKNRLNKFLVILVVIALFFTQFTKLAGATTRAAAVANVQATTQFLKSDPAINEDFTMRLQINSSSLVEDPTLEQKIKDLKIEFDVPKHVKVKLLPQSDIFNIVETNNHIVISSRTDIKISKLLTLDFIFAFEKGIYPNNSSQRVFTTDLKITSSNANITSIINSTATLSEPTKQSYLQAGLVDEEANPHYIHEVEVLVKPEGLVGGVDLLNSQVHISLPEDIIVYSIMYSGKDYPVETDSLGNKYVDIELGTIESGGQIPTILLTYKYPYASTEEEEGYRDIKVTYTAKGNENIYDIKEEKTISEWIDVEKIGEPSDPLVLFKKQGSGKIFKEKDQLIEYDLIFQPHAELKNIYLVDDPMLNEVDYFEAIRFESISWATTESINPTNKGVIKTKMSYQTNKKTTWTAANNEYFETNSIQVATLGLDDDEYITKLRFDYNFNGEAFIPVDAGRVSVHIVGRTNQNITSTTLSTSDNIINTASLYGEIRETWEENFTQISNNQRKLITDYKTRTSNVGFANRGFSGDWRQLFSPIEEVALDSDFNYEIYPANVGSNYEKAVLYVEIPKNVQINDAWFVNSSKVPNGEIKILDIGTKQVVVFYYNRDFPIGGYNADYGIHIECTAKSGTSAYFTSFLGSENATQLDAHGTYTYNMGKFGNVNYNIRMGGQIKFKQDIDISIKKEASVDGENYSSTTNLTGDIWNQLTDKTVYYKVTVANNSTTEFEDIRIIDMLPYIGDTLVNSETSKNSTVTPKVTPISIASGDYGSVKYYQSQSANATNNMLQLNNTETLDSAVWSEFNGDTSTLSSLNAVQIHLKNVPMSSEGAEPIEIIVAVQFTNITDDVKVSWNSVGYGGRYLQGSSEVNIVSGEPYKSGIYISNQSATSSISGIAFEDQNGNDLKDEGEQKLSGLEVNLLDYQGDIVDTTTTDSQGYYEFTQLFGAQYTIEMKHPVDSYTLSTAHVGNDKTIDIDFIDWEGTKKTIEAEVTLGEHEIAENIDAGFYLGADIGDYAWYDRNANGIQETGEVPLANQKMMLVHLNPETLEPTGITKIVSTDSSGSYLFRNVKPGTYQVKTLTTIGYAPTVLTQNATGNAFYQEGLFWQTESFDMKGATKNLNQDLGVIPSQMTISGHVFYDLDYNSVYSLNDDKVFGSSIDSDGDSFYTIELLDADKQPTGKTAITNESGEFVFTNLQSGEYYVQIVVNEKYEGYLNIAEKYNTTGRSMSGGDSSIFNADGTTDKITLRPNSHVTDQNVGLQPYFDLTIKKTNEDNEVLEGVSFTLSKNDVVIDTEEQATNNKGLLVYEKIAAGKYDLTEVATLEGYILPDDSFEIEVNFDEDHVHNKDCYVISFDIENKELQPVEYQFKALKVLENKELEVDMFSFELRDKDGELIETVTNNAEGKIQFEALEFAKAGQYTYTISEVIGDDETIVYDDTEYEITLTVTSNSKILSISSDEEEMVFTNTFVEPITYQIKANKFLENKELEADMFSFELKDKDGELIETVANDAEGRIQFEALEFEKAGEYTYIVSEVIGNDKTMEYDNTKYEITLTIARDGKILIVSSDNENIIFTNKYQKEDGIVPNTGDITPIQDWMMIGMFALIGCIVMKKRNSIE